MPHIDVGGTTLHYLDRGTGPAALFVHGFPLDASMWLDQIDRLQDVRRCLAVDLRGFGASTPRTDEVLTMEGHADDLAMFLAELGIQSADVVALSMGGYVALALAQLHPRVMHSLSLIDTRAGADGAEAKVARDDAIRQVLHDGRHRFAEGLLRKLVAPGASPLVRARLRTMMERTPYETIVAALAGMRDRPDRVGILDRIDVPATVLVGEHDVLTPPADAELMAARLPQGSLHVVGAAGHMTPMEAPDAVAAILRGHFAAVDA